MLKLTNIFLFIGLFGIKIICCEDCSYDADAAKLKCNCSLAPNLLYEPTAIETLLLNQQDGHKQINNFLQALKSLKIFGNLKTLDNATFRTLPKLEELDLSHNEIEIIPDNTFAPFKSLKSLDLSHNRLNSLTYKTLKNLNDLSVLDISYNNIESVLLGVLFRQTKLNKLNLSHNQLSELKLGALDDLKNLKHLDVSYNSIFRIPNGIFDRPNNIETIILDGNNLNTLEKGLFDPLHRSLLTLCMSNCHLTALPLGILDGARKLTHLDISKNPLGSISLGILDTTKDLGVLNVSRCGIKSLPLGILDACPKFHTLDLSYNELHELHKNMFAKSNREMAYLNLSNNQLSDLTQGIFTNTALRVLDISYNDFQSLRIGLLDVETLEELYVQFNKITTLDPETFFAKSERLKHIDVEHNRLAYVTPVVFEMLPYLKHFNIVGNPWKCKCLNELLNILESRSINFNKKEYFDGRKPVCVASENSIVEVCG